MHASKNVSTFEINIFYYFCLWAPLLFLTQSKETVSWCCFYNKNKILAILFLVKYVKNHTFWSVFSVVGAHNLHVQMRKSKQQFIHYSFLLDCINWNNFPVRHFPIIIGNYIIQKAKQEIFPIFPKKLFYSIKSVFQP